MRTLYPGSMLVLDPKAELARTGGLDPREAKHKLEARSRPISEALSSRSIFHIRDVRSSGWKRQDSLRLIEQAVANKPVGHLSRYA